MATGYSTGFRRSVSSQPSCRRELCDPIDREVGQAGQDRAKIVANRDFQSPAGFDDRDYSRDARSGLLASDVDPVTAAQGQWAHGVLSHLLLNSRLRQGDKSLVGNKDYRRYLKVQGDHHFAIDEKQIKTEARYDESFSVVTIAYDSSSSSLCSVSEPSC